MAKKRASKKHSPARKSTAKKSAKKKAPAKKKTTAKKSSAPARKKKRPATPKPAPKKKSSPSKPARRKSSGGGLESDLKRIDREILKLINKRAQLTARLYNERPEKKSLIYDPHAEDELYQDLANSNPGPLPLRTVRSVFREVLSGAKSNIKPVRVAYLGTSIQFHTLRSFGTIRESRRSDSGQHDRLSLRGSESRPRRFRTRAH